MRAWLSSRLPPLLMVLGLLTVAVRPELVLGGTIGQADWGIPRTLLVLALIANALCYGLRRGINWPIAALILVLVQSLVLGHVHPKLTPVLMLEGLAVLALPFAFTSVAWVPGSRPRAKPTAPPGSPWPSIRSRPSPPPRATESVRCSST